MLRPRASVGRRVGHSKPNPPNPEEGARVVQAASEQGQAWGMLVWLTKITGARRGEIVSLRWHDVDLATV